MPPPPGGSSDKWGNGAGHLECFQEGLEVVPVSDLRRKVMRAWSRQISDVEHDDRKILGTKLRPESELDEIVSCEMQPSPDGRLFNPVTEQNDQQCDCDPFAKLRPECVRPSYLVLCIPFELHLLKLHLRKSQAYRRLHK